MNKSFSKMKKGNLLVIIVTTSFLLSGCTIPEKDTYIFPFTSPEEQERKFEIKEEF
ncbi:MAG: hypothetical protein ACFFAU_18205 [Candidatus Hodarchaeota archaeon]